jgi:hypothetical protein
VISLAVENRSNDPGVDSWIELGKCHSQSCGKAAETNLHNRSCGKATQTNPLTHVMPQESSSAKAKHCTRLFTHSSHDDINCQHQGMTADTLSPAAGYDGDEARVDGWRGGRVRPLPGGRWWSDINPAAHRLARAHVLASPDAIAAWDRLAAAASGGGSGGGALPFAVHVWVAGREGTVCAWDGPGGVADMAARLPGAAVREFPGAGHSIHNSAPDAFLAALVAVVDAAAVASGPGPAAAAAARGGRAG